MSNALPSDYISPATKLLLSSAAQNATGYKALVCIFLFGANDSHNTVVPYDGPNRALYETARPYGVRVGLSEVASTILTGTDPVWALNPVMAGFKERWDEGNLAVVRDVGILNKPTSKTQYLSGGPEYKPDRLFAHNVQQVSVQAAVPFKALPNTGWFGRTSNLIDEIYNPTATIGSSTISSSGTATQLGSYGTKISSVYPPVVIGAGNARGSNSTDFYNARDLFYHKNGLPKFDRNIMHNAFRDIFRNSLNSQEDLNANVTSWDPLDGGVGAQIEAVFTAASALISSTTLTTPDPTTTSGVITGTSLRATSFLTTIKNIAKIIYSQGVTGLDQSRQMMFAAMGNYDHHSNLRVNHDAHLATLDISLNALNDALILMGMQDKVTIFTETDFARTFRSNGTYGTDHAWAGHNFVVGGAVQGGVYGPEPDYTLGGSKDISTLGRFVPTFSYEQYYGTLLKWFDVPPELIPLVLPALPLFSPADIGFMG